jgi:DNA polymerase V
MYNNQMSDNKASNNHGGKRPDAGRKVGSGKFSEPTTPIRVPESQTPVIKNFLAAYQRKKTSENMDSITQFEQPELDTAPIELTLYSSKVSAGFPSPADDHVENRLDPSQFLIDQQDATFFVTIQGQSMIDVGLMPGDKAVIDRSKIAAIGDIVLAVIDGEFTIKTLSRKKDGSPRLLPANSTGAYTPIDIKEGTAFEIWGVCTGSFRRFK